MDIRNEIIGAFFKLSVLHLCPFLRISKLCNVGGYFECVRFGCICTGDPNHSDDAHIQRCQAGDWLRGPGGLQPRADGHR